MAHGLARVGIVVFAALLFFGSWWCTRKAKQPPPAAVEPAGRVIAFTGACLHVATDGMIAIGTDAPVVDAQPVRAGSQFKVPKDGAITIRLQSGAHVKLDAGDATRCFVVVRDLEPDGSVIRMDLREGRVALAGPANLGWLVSAGNSDGRGRLSATLWSTKGGAAFASYKGAGGDEEQVFAAKGGGDAVFAKGIMGAKEAPLPPGQQIVVKYVVGGSEEQKQDAIAPEVAALLDEVTALAAAPAASPSPR